LSAPTGFELSPVIQRGEAVVLAFVSDFAPVKPLNQFTARRSHRNTLLRIAVEKRN